jgi:hypothetical protein
LAIRRPISHSAAAIAGKKFPLGTNFSSLDEQLINSEITVRNKFASNQRYSGDIFVFIQVSLGGTPFAPHPGENYAWLALADLVLGARLMRKGK